MRYTVVIPAYNEVESVGKLVEILGPVLAGMSGESEILFVDDGSTDGTADAIDALAERDSRVRLIRQGRNYGKSAAYRVAFAAANGDIVFTLDADLQDDPTEIPAMLAEIERGADLVIGWKVGRMQNEPLKRIPSGVYNGLLNWTFGLSLRDSNSGSRAMRSAVAKSLVLYGDLYRFIPQLAHSQGFRVVEKGVKHHARQFGKSKYGWTRFWTGLLDLVTVRFITRYREKPLHFFATLGLVPAVIGALLEVYVLLSRVAFAGTFQQHVAAIIIGVLFLVVGAFAFGIGLIAELIAAQLHYIRHSGELR
jgi:glycosyltransferase involved in cell wall biosynthesis